MGLLNTKVMENSICKIETIKNRNINIGGNLIEHCKRNRGKVRSKKLVILKVKAG